MVLELCLVLQVFLIAAMNIVAERVRGSIRPVVFLSDSQTNGQEPTKAFDVIAARWQECSASRVTGAKSEYSRRPTGLAEASPIALVQPPTSITSTA